MLELDDLSAFSEAARYGTFSAAAATLYTTQPSLSRRIARLERELGGPLFDRSNRRSPHLAPLGEFLLPYAQRLLADVARFQDLAGAYGKGNLGTVAIVVSESTAEIALPTLYRFMAERFADLTLQVTERQACEIPNAILNREAEVGFVGERFLVSELSSVPFGVTNHVAVGRPRFLGNLDEPIEWEELRHMPLLIGVRVDQMMYPRGREPNHVVHQGGYLGLLRTMARAEMGVVVMGGVRKIEGLVCRPIVDDGCVRRSRLHLAWGRDALLTAQVQRLIDDLADRLGNVPLPLLEENRVVNLIR
jgi:DNA-binding transcriptional LysR family regulator